MISAFYLALSSSFIMSAATILEKKTLKQEHAAAYSASFSFVVALVSLALIFFAKFNIDIIELAIIYVISLISTTTYLLTARVLKHGNISIATPILSSLPMVFLVIISFLFLGEVLTPLQYLLIAILIVSGYLMIFGKDTGKKGFEKSKYAYMLIATCFLMAVGGVAMKYLFLRGVNLLEYFIIAMLFISLNYALFMSLKYGGVKEIFSNLRKYKLQIITIGGLTVSYRILYYLSVYLTFISLVAPIRNSVYVMITTLAGGFLFKETGLPRKIILAGIMLVCLYYLSL